MTDRGVISLAKVREDRTPTMDGPARCVACGHRWDTSAAQGVTWIECPACQTRKGLFVGPCGPPVGGYYWRCQCGCEAFYLTPVDTRCCQCGLAQEGYAR